MPRFFRKSQRYNVAKNSWLARIILLDNTTIDINLQPDVTGADCLERVAQCMEIVEVCRCTHTRTHHASLYKRTPYFEILAATLLTQGLSSSQNLREIVFEP